MNNLLKLMVFSTIVLPTTSRSADIQQNNIFKYVHDLNEKHSKNKDAYRIMAFKIKEWSNNTNYYLIPRLNTMNRCFSDAEDFAVFVRLKSLDDMISYIKKNNLYKYDIDDGLFYSSKESFHKNGFLTKIPMKFDPDECKKIMKVIPNQNSKHWK